MTTSPSAPAADREDVPARRGGRPRDLRGWLTPALVGALALVLRLVGLGHPRTLVFDETYYVKQAASLLQLGYEGEWPKNYNPRFALGDLSGLSTTADYVVHPPFGKWIMALGQLLLGSDDPVGWRLSGALMGTLGVVLVTVLTTRLLRSHLLGATAGILLAVDGEHLVLSRTGLLDVHLSTLVLAGLVLVLADQRWARARLAARLEQAQREGSAPHPWGPRLGVRGWLIAAGLVLGLATGVKWSGLYAVAAFGLLAFALDARERRRAGVRAWFGGAVLRSGVPQFVQLVGTAVVGYLLAWSSWFASQNGYLRQWAATRRAEGEHLPLQWLGSVGDALVSFWHYHVQMYQFHRGLDSEHAYMSHPLGWLIQWRPTSFSWPDPLPADAHCEAARCVQAITSLGNPALWWPGAVALLVVLWAAVVRRQWRAWVVLAGYAATWLPWLQYTDRTIFTFYTVALAPYVALAVTFAVAWVLRVAPVDGPSHRGGAAPDNAAAPDNDGAPARRSLPRPPAARRTVLVVLGVGLLLAVATAVFFWPVWTGQTIPYDSWRARMWLDSWV